jgi:hypothetical protein
MMWVEELKACDDGMRNATSGMQDGKHDDAQGGDKTRPDPATR